VREDRAHGPLAAEVVAALAAADTPLRPAEVRAAIGSDLADDSVRAILVGLWEKGVVARRPVERDHVYWPMRRAAADAAGRMRSALGGRRRNLRLPSG